LSTFTSASKATFFPFHSYHYQAFLSPPRPAAIDRRAIAVNVNKLTIVIDKLHPLIRCVRGGSDNGCTIPLNDKLMAW